MDIKELIAIPCITNPIDKEEAKALNALVLAFVGDSVQTLYVRTKLSTTLVYKTGYLHKLTANEINAKAQAAHAESLISEFREDELDIYKRARNMHSATVAKSTTVREYKKASGLEAVIGYLYLTGQTVRLGIILNKKINIKDDTI